MVTLESVGVSKLEEFRVLVLGQCRATNILSGSSLNTAIN